MRRLALHLALALSPALTADGGPPYNAPGKSSAFYRARLAVIGDHDKIFRFSIELVPDLGRLRGQTP